MAFGSCPNPFSCFCSNTYLVLIGGRLILAHIYIQPCTCNQYGYLSGALSRSWELISPSSIPDLWFVNLVVFLYLLNTRIAKSWNWPKCFSWQVVFEFWMTSWKYYSKWCPYIEAKDLKNIFPTHAFYTILPKPLVVSHVEHNMVFHCVWWPLLIDMHEIILFFWQHMCTSQSLSEVIILMACCCLVEHSRKDNKRGYGGKNNVKK